MKKISFLFTVIIFILSGNRASAQTELQSATLQQGDKTSIYYGKDAFISAFNAVTGVTDVITLSSGTFNSPTFNKACTVYGAGCETDESKGIYSTNVGEITIQHGTEVNSEGETVNKTGDLDGIHIEGIAFTGTVSVGKTGKPVTLKNLTLKRCKFEGLYTWYGSWCLSDVNIINCIIVECIYTEETNNIAIYNSIINRIDGDSYDNKLLIKNCILFSRTGRECIATYKDNIILSPDYNSHDSYLASFFEKNIFRSGNALNYVNSSNKKNNWLGKNDIAIFGEEIGNEYDPSKTYAIKAEAAGTYIGTDGTPVGIYGGLYPFTKTPSNPQIISKEIDVKSTLDGKLKVSIKVEAQK